MKPITLHIYRDAEGVTAVHDGGGIFVTRELIQTLVKDITKFYQSMGDAEIERYITWTKEAGRGRNQRANKGYVYLVKSYDDFYKIGQAVNPQERVRGLQLPYKPKLIHTIYVSDMTWAEKFLHRKFAHKRVEGEWFLLDSKEVAFIKSLQGLEPGYPHLDTEVLPAQS